MRTDEGWRLHADRDGALLVAGLAMGLLLVGGLYHVVSIGDAIIWHEHMQDTADASAFETSVWSARGMNIIVFMNLLMAAAMAWLVALRGIIILTASVLVALRIAEVVACGTSWIPDGISQALCALSVSGQPAVQSANEWAVQTERNTAPRVERFIERVGEAQVVVATVTPIVAIEQATFNTMHFYRTAAFSLSPSLLPVASDLARRPRSNAADPEAVFGPWDRNSMVRIGRGVSLPVSRDGEWKLCEKAGEFVPNELLAIAHGAGLHDGLLDAAGGFIRDLMGSITGTLPAVFCGPRSPSSDPTPRADGAASTPIALQDVIRDAADASCKAAEHKGRLLGSASADDQAKFGDFQGYWSRQSPIVVDASGTATAYAFDVDKCRKDQIAKESLKHAAPARGFKTARVWRYTKNGDFFLQAWGFGYGAAPYLEADDEGLAFPVGGNTAKLVQADPEGAGWDRLSFAESEMYHDCEGAWTDCGGNAMWKMRWKARLRRFHDPVRQVERAVVDVAVQELVNLVHAHLKQVAAWADGRLGRAAGRDFGGGRVGRATDSFVDLLANVLRGNLWDTKFLNRNRVFEWRPISSAAGGVVNHTLGEVLDTSPPAPGTQFIH